ncbi:MAG: hypothetical protein HC880_19755 [Bacteroidia bacterium]|nr:hypothetical protein [Bacteroidia bacterium]
MEKPLSVYERWIKFKSHVLTKVRERKQKVQEKSKKKFNEWLHPISNGILVLGL